MAPNITSVIALLSFIPAAILASAFTLEPGSAPTHPFIKLSANLAMTGWFLGILAIVDQRRFAGWLWGIACAYLWLHVAIVFHVMHAWSHDAAFEHTREFGGLGEGIYANYTLMIVWLIDAIWLLAAPIHYERRPGYIRGFVHGFLGFMVFNGMVVFGTWPSRFLFLLFLVIAIVRPRSASCLPTCSCLG